LIALHGVNAVRSSSTKSRNLLRKSADASSATRTDTRMKQKMNPARTADDTR
jgi:hypothetical protein